MIDQEHALAVAISAARAVGELALARQTTSLQVWQKGYRDFVTEVDLAAQDLIVTRIQEHFPGHQIVAEEGETAVPLWQNGGNPVCTWIIDPIDGTSNYSRGWPNFAVSIALAVDGMPELGVVYDPVHEELYTAVSGAGSFCNGEPLQCSQVSDLAEAILAFDSSRDFEPRQQTLSLLNILAHEVRTIRAIGSAALALCWMANGRLDAYFNFNMKVWDVAAAGLILTEAGGMVSGGNGRAWQLNEPDTWAYCSNGLIHNALSKASINSSRKYPV